MGHSHDLPPSTPRPKLAITLGVIVGIFALLSVAGIWWLMPAKGDVPKADNPYGEDGVSLINATVTAVELFECADFTLIDGMPTAEGPCADVLADTVDGEAYFQLDATRVQAGIEVGDKIRLVRIAPPGEEPSYMFHDFERGAPLLGIAIAFALLAIVVARWRGLLAIGGVAVTMLAIFGFILPAILAGVNALAVAIVGSSAIMIAVLYLAHGISIRTTAALFGTLFGLAITAVLGFWATGVSNLSGLGSEDDMVLIAIAPGVSLSGVVAASMVIAGLGVLNDVTVTQASAVWEMRALQPNANHLQLFISAMRIGRDHIASSIYTLVFAYAGSAMTVLLLITAYDRSLVEMATNEELGSEIVRTLVGAIGLVLAVPATTAIAALLAEPKLDSGNSAQHRDSNK